MKLFKKLLLIFLIIILITLCYLIINGYFYYKKAIDEQSVADRIHVLQEKETFTHYDDLPKYYIDAVICIEDHRFFSHPGIDFFAVLHTFYNNIRVRKILGSGSSISQQVAKNLCFTQEATINRKIGEIFVVYELEKDYSKEDIFEIYVNNMYFGNGYYNIYDASMRIL